MDSFGVFGGPLGSLGSLAKDLNDLSDLLGRVSDLNDLNDVGAVWASHALWADIVRCVPRVALITQSATPSLLGGGGLNRRFFVSTVYSL